MVGALLFISLFLPLSRFFSFFLEMFVQQQMPSMVFMFLRMCVCVRLWIFCHLPFIHTLSLVWYIIVAIRIYYVFVSLSFSILCDFKQIMSFFFFYILHIFLLFLFFFYFIYQVRAFICESVNADKGISFHLAEYWNEPCVHVEHISSEHFLFIHSFIR